MWIEEESYRKSRKDRMTFVKGGVDGSGTGDRKEDGASRGTKRGRFQTEKRGTGPGRDERETSPRVGRGNRTTRRHTTAGRFLQQWEDSRVKCMDSSRTTKVNE